jgi:ammonium transporter, Amt family
VSVAQGPAFSEAVAALAAVSILLVPLAAAGLAMMHAGLGRSRGAAHAMLASLCILSVAALAYFVCGFSWQGFEGRPAHAISAGGRDWNWIAAEPFFLGGLPLDGSPPSLAALLGMFGAVVASVIPLGAGLDRWRLRAACASTALLAGLVYPLFAHWAWGGGWLGQLGIHRGLGRGFLDPGGSGCIQAVGGLSALSIAWILGPRRGKYLADGAPGAIPGHNIVLVLLGCFLTLAGWFGLNAAGAILHAGAPAGSIVRVAANTTLSAAAALLAAVWITTSRFGRPDASLCANGWVGGLAASSAVSVFVSPAAAALTGLATGVLVTFSVEWIDFYLGIDDPAGSISVHAVGGIWGLLALGLFGGDGQLLAQLAGIATLLGFVLPACYGLGWLLDRFYPQRVSAEGEWRGMDLDELGAGAYPEFVIHGDDFSQT